MSKKEIDGFISDIIGYIVVLWTLILLSFSFPQCPDGYVWIIAVGVSAVVGRNLFNSVRGGQ